MEENISIYNWELHRTSNFCSFYFPTHHENEEQIDQLTAHGHKTVQ